MGKVIDFDEKNVIKKAGGDYDFPRLKLENKGDVARILLLEQPTYEWVHTLQHPIIDEDGVPVMQTKQKKNGDDYTVNKMQFIGRPICTGDDGILTENGLDPKNCPVCAFAESNPDRMKAPERRFAMHVFVYNTKKNGDLSTPFGGQVKVWAFGGKYFDQIVALRKEWGDLRKRDIVVVCENPAFNGWDLKIGANAAYLEDPKRTELVKETYVPENLAEDLSIFCGRRTEERFIKQDLLKVSENWAHVEEHKTGRKAQPVVKSLDAALDTLLGDEPKAVIADEAAPFDAAPADGGAKAADFDDLLAGL